MRDNFKSYISAEDLIDMLIESWSAKAIKDQSGKITELLIDGNDITELSEIRKKLAKESSLFETLLDSIPVGVMIADEKHIVQSVSKFLGNVLGKPAERFLNTDEADRLELIDLRFPNGEKIKPGDLPLSRSISTGESVKNFEILLKKKEETRYISTNAMPIHDGNGNVAGAISVWQDITEQKNILEEAHRRRGETEAILNSFPGAYIIYGCDGSVQKINDHARTILGFTDESIVLPYAKRWGLINALDSQGHRIPLEQLPSYRAMRGETVRNSVMQIVRPDVHYWISASASPIISNGVAIGAVMEFADISESKIAEEKLRISGQQYKGIFDNAAIGIVVIDQNDKFSAVNDHICQMLGYKREELLTMDVRQLTAPEDRERSDTINAQILGGKFQKLSYEKRYLKRDGTPLWVNVTVSGIRDTQNRHIESIGTVEDISGRKQAEEALARALAKAEEGRNILNALMEHIPIGIAIAGAPDVNIRMVSKYGQKLTEKTSEEMAGIPAPEHPSKWGLYHADGVTPGTPDELPLTRATQKGEVVINEEWILTRKDGTLIPILCNAAPIYDVQKNVVGGVIGWQDFSEQRRAREALRQSEARFRTMGESVDYGVWAADAEGKAEYISPSFCQMAGRSLEEMLSFGWLETLVEEQRQKVVDLWMHSVRTGEPYEYEYQIKSKSGEIRFVLSRGKAIRNEKGEIVAWAGINLDITERKHFEMQLRNERELFQSIINRIPVMITLYDPGINRIEINNAVEQILGYTEKEAQEKDLMELAYPNPEERMIARNFMQSLEPGFKDIVMTARTGERIETSWANIRLPDGRQVGIGVDNRERNRAIKEIEAHRRLLEIIVQSLTIGVGLYRGHDLIVEMVNPVYLTIAPGKEILGRRCKDVWAEVFPQVEDKFRKVLETGEPYHAIDQRFEIRRSSNGPLEQAYFTWSLIRVPIPGENYWGLLNIVSETTERKKIELEIIGQRQFLETVLNNLNVAISVKKGRELVITYVNPVYKAVYSGGDLLGKRLRDVNPGVDLTGSEQMHLKVLETGEPMSFRRFHYSIPGKPDAFWDGQYVRLNPVSAGDEASVLTLAWDVTDQKRAEDKVRQRTDELAAANKELESFSYSVAHDLRNPLKVIKGFIEYLHEDCSEKLDSECKDYIKRIKDGAERMSSIIDDILALSKLSRQEMETATVNLSELAALRFKELKEEQPGRDVDVYIEEDLVVQADARLMSVALGNLLGNAWKYTANVKSARIEFRSFMQDKHKVYYVKDNGAGFDMRHADKLFKPFKRLHSDKEFKGTGVGLAIVERAIRRHGGKVWAEGEVGNGAIFFFTLGQVQKQV